MKVRHFKYLPRGVKAMAIYPYILLKDMSYIYNKSRMTHEMIHLEQQKELFWLPFFIMYFVEWIVRLIQYGNFEKAYRNISFEREAFKNEYNYNYLTTREKFSFKKYFKL